MKRWISLQSQLLFLDFVLQYPEPQSPEKSTWAILWSGSRRFRFTTSSLGERSVRIHQWSEGFHLAAGSPSQWGRGHRHGRSRPAANTPEPNAATNVCRRDGILPSEPLRCCAKHRIHHRRAGRDFPAVGPYGPRTRGNGAKVLPDTIWAFCIWCSLWSFLSFVRIDSNVDDAQLNVEAAHDELLRYFRSISSNRWLMVKVFGVVIVFILIFAIFFA